MDEVKAEGWVFVNVNRPKCRKVISEYFIMINTKMTKQELSF